MADLEIRNAGRTDIHFFKRGLFDLRYPKTPRHDKISIFFNDDATSSTPMSSSVKALIPSFIKICSQWFVQLEYWMSLLEPLEIAGIENDSGHQILAAVYETIAPSSHSN